MLLSAVLLAAASLAFAPQGKCAEHTARGFETPTVYAPSLEPPDASLETPEKGGTAHKIEFLLEQVRRLNMFARRATIAATAELQLTDGRERAGAEMTLSGGPLEFPLECTTNELGQCAFIVPPLEEGAPDYILTVEMKKFRKTTAALRPAPASITMLPLRVELEQEYLEKRIGVKKGP